MKVKVGSTSLTWPKLKVRFCKKKTDRCDFLHNLESPFYFYLYGLSLFLDVFPFFMHHQCDQLYNEKD